MTRKMTLSERYLDLGEGFGVAAGFLTFIIAYIYCTASYGFLFGFGLGWLPSAVLAAVVGGVVVFIWAPVLVAVLSVAGFFLLQILG